ncbi:ferredoxin [Micromonospora sp. NPDC002296]|uniref:ferredoxin n=1 Tax=Micromonospora sp. NPDC002296 TaxID=3154271 RepID=UPI0033189594
MRITVDRERCMSAGQCVMTAPDIFTEDEDGLSMVEPGREDDGADPLVREAVFACPVQAISVADDERGVREPHDIRGTRDGR